VITIVRAAEADWVAARDVRLQALAADPSAFGSTLERELRFTESDWRQRLAGGGWHLALAGDVPVGLVSSRPLTGEQAELEINAMWVRPDQRGQRIGEQLLAAAIDGAGTRKVRLWVTTGNDAAIALYARHGFVPTGRTEPLPSDPRLIMLEYALSPA